MARKNIIHFENEKEMIDGVAKLINDMVRKGGKKAEDLLNDFSVDVKGVGYKIDDREMQKEVEEFVKKHHQAVLDAKTKITKDNRLLQESIDTIRNNEGSIAMPSVNADDIKRMEADNKKLGKLLAMREKILKDIRDYDAESDSKKKKAMLPSYNNALVQLKELEKLGKEYNKNNTVKFKIDYEGVDVKKIKRDTRNLYKEILNPDTMGTDKDIATKMEGSVNDLYDNLVEEIIKGSSELQSKLRKSIKKSVREATGSILSDTETKELAKQMMSGFDVGDIKGFKELEGKTDSLEKQLQDSIEEINKLKSELKGVTGEEFNDLKTNVSDLKTKFGELKNSLKEVNDILSGKSDNKFLDQLMADVTENISKIDELESKLKTIDNVNSDNTAGLNSLFNSQADIKDEISAIKSSFDNVFTKAREEIGKVKAELDGVTTERFSGLTEGVNSLNSEFTELNRIIHLVIDEINNINTALDSTKKDATVVNSGNRVLQDLKSEAEQADKTVTVIKELTDAFQSVSTSDEIEKEIDSLENLRNKLIEVIASIDTKSDAFKNEGVIVNEVVDNEILKLESLNNSINEVINTLVNVDLEKIGLQKFSDVIDSLNSEIDKFNQTLEKDTGFRTFVNDIKELTNKGQELQNLSKIVSESKKKIKEANIQINGDKAEYVKESKILGLQKQVRDLMNKNTVVTRQFREELQDVYYLLNNKDISTDEFEEIYTEFKRIQNDITKTGDANKTVLNLQDRLEKARRNTLGHTSEYSKLLDRVDKKIQSISNGFSRLPELTDKGVEKLRRDILVAEELLNRVDSNKFKQADLSAINRLRSNIKETLSGIVDSKGVEKEVARLNKILNSLDTTQSVRDLEKAQKAYKNILASMKSAKAIPDSAKAIRKEIDSMLDSDDSNRTDEYRESLVRVDDEFNTLIKDFKNGVISADNFALSLGRIKETLKSLSGDKYNIASFDDRSSLDMSIKEYLNKNKLGLTKERSNALGKLRKELNDSSISMTVERYNEIASSFKKIKFAVLDTVAIVPEVKKLRSEIDKLIDMDDTDKTEAYKVKLLEIDDNLNQSIKDFDRGKVSVDTFNASLEKTKTDLKSLKDDSYILASIDDKSRTSNSIKDFINKNITSLKEEQVNELKKLMNTLSDDTLTKKGLREVSSDFDKLKSSIFDTVAISPEVKKFSNEINRLLSSDNSNKTSEYVEGLKRLDSELKQLIQDFNSGKISAEQFSKSFNSISNQKNLLTTDKKGTTLVGADKKAALYDDVNKYMKYNSKAMLAYRDELNGILNGIKATKTISELEKVKAEFYEIRTAARTAGLDGMTLLDGIITRAKSIGKTLISYFTVFDAFRYIREIGTVVTELDTAMTELKKVSDSTAVALENFSKKAFDIADTVGTTAQQLINSTADWQRLGESLSDAQKSAQTSNILLNVSEFENIDDATTSLVSMSQAYKDLEKIDIVDKLNVIGNNYSISTNKLAASLQRSAATLSTAGNSLDEAIALTVAGNSITQDAEMVGAGLRTISLRIMGTEEAKKELEEMGESTDDYVVQTKSKLQDLIKDYTAVASNQFKGFDILTETGEYKSTFHILLGIAKIYKEIQETDAKFGTNRGKALLEALAGKNRSNIAASILQNPQLLEDVYKSSQEEYKGSAQHELDTYLDSVEGRLTQIKNKGQEISSDLISSDSIKVVLEGFKGILTVVDAIVKHIGTIPLLLGSIGGIIGTKDNVGLIGATYDKYGMANDVGITPKTKISQKDFQDDIIKSYNNLTNEFNSGGIDRVKYQQEYNNILSATNKETETLIKANKGLIISEASKAEAIKASGTAAKAASLGFKALALAGNMLLGLSISAAISLIITGLDKLIVTSKEAKENFDSLQEDVKSGEQEVTRLNTEIATINEKISEIQSKGTITLSDQADLDRLISEREELESQLALQKKLNAAKRKEATNEVFDEFNPLTKEAKQKIESADSELKTKEEFNKVENYGQGVSVSLSKQYKTYDDYVKAYKDRMDDLKNEILDEIPTIEAAIAQIESTNPNGKGLVGDKKDKYNELKDLLSKAYEKVYDNKEYYDIILKPVLSQEELKNFEEDFKNVVNNNGLELSDFLNENGEADKNKMIKYFDSTVVDAFFESMQQNGIKVQDALSRMFDINSVEVDNRRNGNVSLGLNGSTVELYSKGFENEYNQRKEIIKEEMSKFNDWSRDNPELKQFGEQIRNNTVRSMFGNVNMDDRVIINWTDELKERYSEALKSWDYNPEVGSVDTVFGGSSSFDINGKEVEVAFTPVVNTNGEAEFLGATTLQTYIDNIIKEATKDGQWSVEEILALDKEGINNADVYDSAGKKIGETFIHGVIAGIGNSEGITPETIGMLMHFAGNYGSIGLANQGSSNYSNIIGNHILGENPYTTSTGNETDDIYNSQQRILFEKKKKEITEYVAKNFKPEQIKVLLGMDIPKKVLNMTEKEIKDWLDGLDLKIKIEDAEFSGKETFKNLDTIKSGLGSITDALGDYKEHGVDIDPSKVFALKDINGYETFADILAEYPDDIDKVREAFNQLGTTYLDTCGFLDNLTYENKELYVQQLENMGVENAREFVMSRLINTDREASIELKNLADEYNIAAAKGFDMNNVTYTSILNLYNEAKAANVDATALATYLTRKQLASSSAIMTTASVKNLATLVKGLGLSVDAIDDFNSAVDGNSILSRSLNTGSQMANEEAMKGMNTRIRQDTSNAVARLNKKAAEIENLAPSGSNAGTPRSGNPKSNTSKQKKELNLTRQLYDWIERRLDLLSKAVDRAKSKMERLLDWDKKKNATKKAIEAVRTELNATYKAAKRYFDYGKKIAKEEAKAAAKDAKKNGSKKQADKYGKNLTKKQIKDYTKLVEEGQIGKKDLQSIKDPRIKAFVDALIQWNDKAKACLETADDLRDEMADLYETLANNPIDKAAEQIEKLSDKMSILEKKSNNFLRKINDSGFNTTTGYLSTYTVPEEIYKNRNEQLENSKKQLEEYNKAYRQTISNNAEAERSFAKIKSSTKTYFNKQSAKSLGITSDQFKELKKYIKSGEEIPDKIKRLLSGTPNKKVVEYNEAVIKAEKMKLALETAESNYLNDVQDSVAREREIELNAINTAIELYNNELDILNAKEETLSNQVTLMEQYGRVLDRGNYDVQIGFEQDKIELYEQQREELKALLYTVDEYSKEWYEARNSLNEMNTKLSESVTKVYELKKAANEISNTLYDLATGITGRMSNEFSFLADLMEGVEDFNPLTHLATNEGYARLFTYTAQMETSKGEAQRAKEIVEEYNRAIENAQNSGSERVRATIMGLSVDYTIQEAQAQVENFYDQWRDQIKLTKDAENKLIEWEIKKLEEEVALAQEMVNKRKEALTAEKDLHDYQRSIQDATTNINNLQKQITVLSGDNSQEGKARVQALQKQLKDAQQNLKETEYDRYISDQQNMLDNLMEEYTTLTDEEKLHREELLDRALADMVIHTEEITQTIDTAMGKYGYKPEYAQGILKWLQSPEMEAFRENVKNSLINLDTYLCNKETGAIGTLSTYISAFNSVFSLTGDSFASKLQKQIGNIASQEMAVKLQASVASNNNIVKMSDGEVTVDNNTSLKVTAGSGDTTNAGGTGGGNGFGGGTSNTGSTGSTGSTSQDIYGEGKSVEDTAKDNPNTAKTPANEFQFEDPNVKALSNMMTLKDLLKIKGITIGDLSKRLDDYSPLNQLIWANTGQVVKNAPDGFKALANYLGVKYDNANTNGTLFNKLINLPFIGNALKTNWQNKIAKFDDITNYIVGKGKVPDKNHNYKAVNAKLSDQYGVVLGDSVAQTLASKYFGITDYSKGWQDYDSEYYRKLHELGVFAKGGLVKAIKNRGEDGIAMVRDGEGILTPAQTKTFAYELAPRIDDIIDSSKIIKDATSNFNKLISAGDTNVEATFQFDLENVTSASDIIKQIQSNNNVQNAIRSVTVDRIAGGSRLGVNMYK